MEEEEEKGIGEGCFASLTRGNMTSYYGNKLGRARLYTKKKKEKEKPLLLFCVLCVLPSIGGCGSRRGKKMKKTTT